MTKTSKSKKTKVMRFVIALIFFWFIPVFNSYAQPRPLQGIDLIQTYRNNVIRLSVQFSDESSNDGFGFVVGEQSGYLYIVTAQHVVWTDQPGVTSTISASFFTSRAENVQATRLNLSYENLDIALIRIEKPSSYNWKRCSYTIPETNKRIWYIGRNKEWWIPATLETGEIIDSIIQPNLNVRIGGVEEGSSGAPMMSENGIIGMITGSSSEEAFALDIRTIKRCVKDIWHYPWNLESRAGQVCRQEVCNNYIDKLLKAADFGNFQEIRRILEMVGVDVNCQNAHGMTALYVIAGTEKVDEQTQIQIVLYLLNRGADKNLSISDDFYGRQYIHWKPIDFARSTYNRFKRPQHREVIILLENH